MSQCGKRLRDPAGAGAKIEHGAPGRDRGVDQGGLARLRQQGVELDRAAVARGRHASPWL